MSVKITVTIHDDSNVSSVINALERTKTHLSLEIELRKSEAKIQDAAPMSMAPPSRVIFTDPSVQERLAAAKDDWLNNRKMTIAEILEKYNVPQSWLYSAYGNRTNMKQRVYSHPRYTAINRTYENRENHAKKQTNAAEPKNGEPKLEMNSAGH